VSKQIGIQSGHFKFYFMVGSYMVKYKKKNSIKFLFLIVCNVIMYNVNVLLNTGQLH